MIFELIKDWIWNIGGVFFSIMLMLVIINWIIEHFLIGWHKKNVRNIKTLDKKILLLYNMTDQPVNN